MGNRKVSFYTLGCRVNQYETEMMKERFESLGWEIAGEGEWADAYIINTCTVTNMADRKSRQFIRRCRRQNENAVICVTGCYAQVSEEEVANIEGVDMVIGTSDKGGIPYLVDDVVMRKYSNNAAGPLVYVRKHYKDEEYAETGIVTSMEGKTRAFVKVQEGCNRFCAYCEIPFARGDVRSRRPEAILEEAKQLVASGFKEIVLTGINTALYGTESSFKPEFSGGMEKYRRLWEESCDEEGRLTYGTGLGLILSMINDIPGDFRIRISSLEPTVVSAGDLESILGYEKLCHHLHLSVQSGSDKVLHDMNRKYDREEYLKIVRALYDFDPHFGISTDIIAGFPGESEEDFECSLDIIEKTEFCKVHAFDYSKRNGTKAAAMENQIAPEVKKERVKRLIEEGEEAKLAFLKKSAGDVRRVLIEERDEKSGLLTGYTDNYIRVYLEGDDSMLNTFADVRLGDVFEDGVIAAFAQKINREELAGYSGF